MQHDRPKIVDPMGLIGVLMRQKHRIDVIDIGVDQLFAQVGRGINHDPRDPAIARPLDKQRATAAAVFSDYWDRRRPSERGTRHAGRGSAAENCQRQRHAVASAAGTLRTAERSFPWSGAKSPQTRPPRVSASTLATSTT